MNHLAATTENKEAIGEIFNTAIGERTDLNLLTTKLKALLSNFDSSIDTIEIKHGPERKGDIPHSLASIEKAKQMLNYNPTHDIEKGLEEAIDWYWEDLK